MFNNLVYLEVVIIDYPMTIEKVNHVNGPFVERSRGYFKFELVSPSYRARTSGAIATNKP